MIITAVWTPYIQNMLQYLPAQGHTGGVDISTLKLINEKIVMLVLQATYSTTTS